MIWEKAFKEDGSLNKDELYLFCNSLNAVAPVMLREFGNEWRPISNKFAVQCGRFIKPKYLINKELSHLTKERTDGTASCRMDARTRSGLMA